MKGIQGLLGPQGFKGQQGKLTEIIINKKTLEILFRESWIISFLYIIQILFPCFCLKDDLVSTEKLEEMDQKDQKVRIGFNF